MRRPTSNDKYEISIDERYLIREDELARRWRISHRTLQRWRRKGRAPAHLRLGTRVLFRPEDIDAFEALCIQQPEDR